MPAKKNKMDDDRKLTPHARLGRDLRTPLTTIVGCSGMLLSMDLAADQRQLVELVHGSANEMWKRIDALDAPAEGAAAEESALQPVNASTGEPSRGPLDVLVVEDDASNREIVVRILQWSGHRTFEATSGDEALTFLQGREVHVVIMDVDLPGASGPETTSKIRARERGSGRRVPVIALTALSSRKDRLRCLEAGMDGFLTKPLQAKTLLEEVQRLARAGPALPPEPAHGAGLKVVSMRTALANVGGSCEVLASLALGFVARAPELIERLRAAITAHDVEAFDSVSSGVLATCAVFSTRSFSDLIEALRRLVHSRHEEAASAVLTTLEAELEVLLSDLRIIVESGGVDPTATSA